VRPPQGVAVQRHNFLGHRLAQALGPAQETIQKLLRIDGRKNPFKSVVGRDAVGQSQKAFEPFVLGPPEFLHVIETLAGAQERADGDHQHVDQRMFLPAIDPRIGHQGKVGN